MFAKNCGNERVIIEKQLSKLIHLLGSFLVKHYGMFFYLTILFLKKKEL